MDANRTEPGPSSTVIGVTGGGAGGRGGVSGAAGVVFDDDEVRLFVSSTVEASTSGTPSGSGGLMIGRLDGEPADFGGNSETRTVTLGDGLGGAYNQFSGSAADGGPRSVEGEILTLGVAHGLSGSYGSSQTATITVEDAASAVSDFVASVVNEVYFDDE